MVNAQEWLDKWYPKEGTCIFKEDDDNFGKRREEIVSFVVWTKVEGSLDLSDFVNLEKFSCSSKQFTSVDFLNTLPNPEKLWCLHVFNNNIQPTDIAIFSKFVNLRDLKIGTQDHFLNRGNRNKFYGSLKSYQNLTKLENICIEATDVDSGLEYLPFSLAQSTTKAAKRNFRGFGGYTWIECSSHNTQAKCSAIQNELRPFNYDLLAWQFAHPEKMLISHPEYFTNPDSKEQWLQALNKKIENSKEILIQTKEQESDKLSQIARLESKIQELELAKAKIDQQTQTEFSTQEKSTQTLLSSQQIEQLEKENQQLQTLLQATETELTNTKQKLSELEAEIKELHNKDFQKSKALENQQAEIKQLKSKITLLEQQKTTYQEKFNNSLQFIKDVRKELAEGEEWRPTQ